MHEVIHPLTGIHFQSIGLGCATFGREIDEAAAFKLMDRMLASGITLLDTAAKYSFGASERIVGRWVRSRGSTPCSVQIATKLFPPYTPESVERGLEESCVRLSRPNLDIFYLHQWDESVMNRAVLAKLDNLVTRGLIRAIGVSNFNLGQLNAVVKMQMEQRLKMVSVLQNNNNYATRDVDDTLLNYCMEKQIAVVTYSPLGAGFLTGKHSHGIAPDSRFALAPGHQQIYLQPKPLERLAALTRLSKSTGYSQTMLALAWAFSRPGVATVLVGGRTSEHFDQAINALSFSRSSAFKALDFA